MQRPWMGAAYWLAPHGLFSLLSYTTPDHQPRSAPTQNGLGPSPSIVNYENALQTCLQPYLLEAFSQLRFPSDFSILCQVDIK